MNIVQNTSFRSSIGQNENIGINQWPICWCKYISTSIGKNIGWENIYVSTINGGIGYRMNGGDHVKGSNCRKWTDRLINRQTDGPTNRVIELNSEHPSEL